MIVKWEPDWYELDQSIVVGDIDLFYLTKDNLYFANGLSSENYDREVKAEILKITHPELGAIRGIMCRSISLKKLVGRLLKEIRKHTKCSTQTG